MKPRKIFKMPVSIKKGNLYEYIESAKYNIDAAEKALTSEVK